MAGLRNAAPVLTRTASRARFSMRAAAQIKATTNVTERHQISTRTAPRTAFYAAARQALSRQLSRIMKTTGHATLPSRISRPPVPLELFLICDKTRRRIDRDNQPSSLLPAYNNHGAFPTCPSSPTAPYIRRKTSRRATSHRGKPVARNHQISPMPAMGPFAAARTLRQPQRLHRPSAATPQTRKHPKLLSLIHISEPTRPY